MFLNIRCFLVFFFFNDTATTEIYTLSLHDALPISASSARFRLVVLRRRSHGAPGHLDLVDLAPQFCVGARNAAGDRKSTRLNSSHANISYAVFCLKKKKTWQS